MSGIEFILIPKEEWQKNIVDIIAVRESAYEQWNGLMTSEQRNQEAINWLGKWFEHKNPLLLVAKNENTIVAFIKADERVKGEYFIAWIGVRQDFKRQGIGLSLIRKCEETAKGYECSGLTTTTYYRFKGILILLLSKGFYIQGTIWVQGSSEPRLYLRKELKA